MLEHTDRQLRVWLAHMESLQDHPGTVEHYLMQVAAEVRKLRVEDPSTVKLEDLKLVRKGSVKPMSKEEATAWSKRRWLGWLGFAGRVSDERSRTRADDRPAGG